MLSEGPAARLTIHLSGAAMWHRRPAYVEIVHRARRAGLAGASVLHAVEGFGSHLEIRHEHASQLSQHSHNPTVVIIVEDERRLRDFLVSLADILGVNGVAIIDAVRVYVPRRR
jgi:uncharacterized protein